MSGTGVLHAITSTEDSTEKCLNPNTSTACPEEEEEEEEEHLTSVTEEDEEAEDQGPHPAAQGSNSTKKRKQPEGSSSAEGSPVRVGAVLKHSGTDRLENIISASMLCILVSSVDRTDVYACAQAHAPSPRNKHAHVSIDCDGLCNLCYGCKWMHINCSLTYVEWNETDPMMQVCLNTRKEHSPAQVPYLYLSEGKRHSVYARVKRSQRCGHCHTCRNPQLKRACLTLRAKQESGDEQDSNKVSMRGCTGALELCVEACIFDDFACLMTSGVPFSRHSNRNVTCNLLAFNDVQGASKALGSSSSTPPPPAEQQATAAAAAGTAGAATKSGAASPCAPNVPQPQTGSGLATGGNRLQAALARMLGPSGGVKASNPAVTVDAVRGHAMPCLCLKKRTPVSLRSSHSMHNARCTHMDKA
eukprot:1158173-Pelagomonas_calceolata.AAC.4